jgi:Ca-activated chloride channel family protein
MVSAISKPFTYDSSPNQHRKGLAIDANGSMAQSRFETILKLSQDFIKNRFDDNMGVVIFGTLYI